MCCYHFSLFSLLLTEIPDTIPDRGDVVGDEGEPRLVVAPETLPTQLPEGGGERLPLENNGEKLGKFVALTKRAMIYEEWIFWVCANSCR